MRNGGVAAVELSAEPTDLGAVSKRRSQGVASWELPARVEPSLPVEVSICRTETGAGGHEEVGPTPASKHLASDDGLAVHAETLRRWLKEAGLWQRQRRRQPYRRRREAKAHFGELVQLDGTFHLWLEERGPCGCLMQIVDDASTQARALFSAEESMWAAVAVLRRWIERSSV